jgi:site-specific DNA-methyltransferase (adenine-specific)
MGCCVSDPQLYLGDCLDVFDLALDDQSVDLVLCDLPYGTTQNKWDTVIPFDRLWQEYKRICRGAIVLTAAQPFTSAVVMSNPTMFKYQWVWNKSKVTGVLNAKKQPLRNHEDVLVFYGSQPTYNPQGLQAYGKRRDIGAKRAGGSSENYGALSETVDGLYLQENTGYPRSVLAIPSEGNTVHPTQKPVALMEYLIRTYTNEGDTVLDNCMGSGTTGVACANTGRKFIGIERDEKYFEIARQRIEEAYAADLL